MKEIKAYKTSFGTLHETKEDAEKEEQKIKRKECKQKFREQAWEAIENYMKEVVAGESGLRKPHSFFAEELVKRPEYVGKLAEQLVNLRENIYNE